MVWIGPSIDLTMGSIFNSSIFPKNFRVRWIFSGLPHRTSAWDNFKSPWISSIFFWIVLGSSIARKDRINQKPLHNPLNPPLIPACGRQEGGFKEGLLYFDVNITTKKVNEKNLCNYSQNVRFFLTRGLFLDMKKSGRGYFLFFNINFPKNSQYIEKGGDTLAASDYSPIY